MNLDSLNSAGIAVTLNTLLKDHTTFRLGGPCRAMIHCLNAAQVTLAVSFLRTTGLPFLVMGSGSNILAADAGVDTVIVRYTSATPIIKIDGNIISVDAATQFDTLASFAIDNGFDGMTGFSGIPGTVGGAIAGNAGAYGQQISDHLIDITVLKTDNTVALLPKASIRFEYRDSDIKHNGEIILSARFLLQSADNRDALQQKRLGILETRLSKHGHWEKNPCAGSFFRNVDPTSKAGPRQSAGWFIEQAGAKDMTVGKAHSYVHHANIITRDDGATAQDVYDFTKRADRCFEQVGHLKACRVKFFPGAHATDNGNIQFTGLHDNIDLGGYGVDRIDNVVAAGFNDLLSAVRQIKCLEGLHAGFGVDLEDPVFHDLHFRAADGLAIGVDLPVDVRQANKVIVNKNKVAYAGTYQAFDGITSHPADPEHGNGGVLQFFKGVFSDEEFCPGEFMGHKVTRTLSDPQARY